MSRIMLQDIIEGFAPDKFTHFFRQKNRNFAPRSEQLSIYDDADFNAGQKLGEIHFDSGEEMIFCTFASNKPLSERSGKKAQYEKAKKILKEKQADAGIFIYYDDNGSFRFSLVYANYLGKKRDWSSFRRFTYFVDDELTNKTFLSRIGDGDFSSLSKIKDAFSVEKVTKEFYESIANWYFWAVEHARFPKGAETEENGRNIAVIRLITRMIFVWFMRERGLMPKHLFEKESIDKILVNLSAEDSTYYTAILQNLFFATLSTKKAERKFRSEVRGHKGYNPDFGNQYVYRYHKLFKKPDEIESHFGEIPFLNGGLFECLDNGRNNCYVDGFTARKQFQPIVPNFLFFSQERKADLNKAYGTKKKIYKVRGLLDILFSYNFTIDENSPDDADVALDPELLGRVFENLLASFNPETSTTARKATGSYYTRREIVDYMVTESLKAYFKTHLEDIGNIDEKLKNLFSNENSNNPFDQTQSKKLIELIESVKIVDPAVGSGAFPMGALNRLVFILNKIDHGNELWKQAQLKAVDAIPDPSARRMAKQKIEEFFQGKNADYGRKLFLIQRCIYGVDIQQIAVEIAKLRFFISLLVDEKVDKEKDNWGIEPLPNLDFKIMQGNSLIELLSPSLLAKNTDSERSQLIDELKACKDEFLCLSDPAGKKKCKERILKLVRSIVNYDQDKKKEELERNLVSFNEKPKLFEMSGDNLSLDDASIKKQAKISAELKQLEKVRAVSPKDHFEWHLHFNEVFENGGFDVVIANPPYIKEYTQKSAFDGLRYSPYYKGKMDIWYLFACKNLDFLKKDSGVLTFIAQNNWITSYGASILRNKVISDTQIKNLIDFGDYKIFECAGIQTMVMIFQKEEHKEKYSFDYRRLIGQNLKFEDVLDILHKQKNGKAEYLQPTIIRKEFKDKPLTFSNSQKTAILERIFSKANFKLDPGEDVAQGIVYPQDYVNKLSQKILGNKYNIGDGIFVLSDQEKNNISFTKKELELIKPSYTTKELFRWHGNFQNKEWVIYTDSSFKNKSKILYYPNIKSHLDQFKKVITSDNKPYGLHRARDENFFLGEKIISARKCAMPTFSFIDFDCYVSATFYVIKTERINQKYLICLLNSNLFSFWLRNKGKMQGNNYQIDKEPLINLPIIKASESEQNSFIVLVDKILAITKSADYLQNQEKQAHVNEYERQIDQMVYKLYDLRPEEIEIVEHST